MNAINIVSTLSAMPEGITVENRRQRVTVVLALACALVVPMPSSPISQGDLRGYFKENADSCRAALFEINEALPFDVDRACEYAFRLYERRYNIAFNTKASDLLQIAPFSQTLLELMPEIETLKIQNAEVFEAVNLLRV